MTLSHRFVQSFRAGFIPALLLLSLGPTELAARQSVRGLWVIRTSITTPEKVRSMLDFAQRNQYTDIFVQVRGRADAYYTSRIVPRATYIPSATFDPLAAVVSGAHRRGMKVHAWVNVFLAWSARTLPADPQHIVNRHPDWVEINGKGESDLDLVAGNGRNGREGIYLSPAHPDVRAHLLAVMDEIVQEYAIDGIHLDYVRYQDRVWGYNRMARKQFLMEYSVDPITLGNSNGSYWYRMSDHEKEIYWAHWNDFRRHAVDQFVNDLHLALDRQAPQVMLTAAVKPNPNRSRERFFQDWPEWVRKGWVDAVVLMNYAKDARDFTNNIYLIEKEDLDRDQLYMGIATYNQVSAQAADKIRRAYDAGYRDLVIFSYDTVEKNPRYFDDLHRVLK